MRQTLTSAVSSTVGNRALGEVHQEMLDLLVDSDGDALADTLREQLLEWIVGYNLPGAAVPYVSRQRPKNEKAEAETRQVKAGATALPARPKNPTRSRPRPRPKAIPPSPPPGLKKKSDASPCLLR